MVPDYVEDAEKFSNEDFGFAVPGGWSVNEMDANRFAFRPDSLSKKSLDPIVVY